MKLVFEWHAEDSTPSPQTDILLQMWVDVFEKKLHLLEADEGEAEDG